MATSERKSSKRIRFGSYPYTATRVRVMKTLLLKPADYARMEKMGLHELIRFLEEGQYKEEIDRLAARFSGAELLELALSANMAKNVNKVLRIAQKPEVRLIIQQYAQRWVFANLKAVLRVRFNRLGKEELPGVLVPIEPTSTEYCVRLLGVDEEMLARELEKVAGLPSREARKLLTERNLLGLENALDRAYYSGLSALTHRIRSPKQDPLKAFLHWNVDLLNLKNLLRLKAAESAPAPKELPPPEPARRPMPAVPSGGDGWKGARAGSKDIMQFLVLDPEANKKYQRLWAKFIQAKDLEALRHAAAGSKFERLLREADELGRLENAIDRFLLSFSYRLLRQRPLSVSPIFGFLVYKELEVRNIRLLLHSKALGLGEAFVAENLALPERVGA